MDKQIGELFIPGPAGRIETKYFKNNNNTAPVALVLQPHPQYGGTMNNKIVFEIFQTFLKMDFLFVELILEGLVKVMENLIMDKENYLMPQQLWIGLREKI